VTTEKKPLRVVYLLEGSALFGGTKVVLQQANLLLRRGHDVTVVGKEPDPTWFRLEARYRRAQELEPAAIPEADVVVATFWSTLAPALAAGKGPVVHYCQGLEYTYTHNGAEHERILEAYRQPLPALVVSPHLGIELESRFGRRSRLVLQPLESGMRSHGRLRPRRRPRVLVVGPYEIDWKGVKTALLAAQKMRDAGVDFRLVRLSQWPQTDAEREVCEADEYHCHLRPQEVARLLQQADLLLAPSWEQEGFGLPVLEAMSCGVPVVCSNVSCYRGFAEGVGTLVPTDDPEAFAFAGSRLLVEPDLWRRHRHAGLTRAMDYSEDRATASAEAALQWVVAGAPA
jgi:glycosyltransferase involved in cell wall biosynthesis